MASFIHKARTILTNREIQKNYCRYLGSRLLGREPIVYTPDGASFVAPPRFSDYYAIARQHPSAEEINLFKSIVSDGDVVFDVGANMGLYSVMAGRARKPSRIIAFEPIHRYCVSWHQNVERNQIANATLFQCAVDDHGGIADFTLDFDKPLNNRIAIGESTASTAVKTRVSALTLDQITSILDIDHIDLLKIDVEGGEPRVLRGAQKLLENRRVRCLYIEFIIEFMEAMGDDPSLVYDEVVSKGYDIHEITPAGQVGKILTKTEAVDGRRAPPGTPERDYWGLNLVINRRD